MIAPARLFRDRRDAGVRLAERLRQFSGRKDVVILALPRGGVPVASEVARILGLPLDVFVVRKLGLPGHEEFALGAVASGGSQVLNEQMVREFMIPAGDVAALARREMTEVARRDRLYRGDRPFPDLTGRTVILIDDGIATGATAVAATRAVRRLGPSTVIIATPVIADDTRRALGREADDVVCVASPETFVAVGAWYQDFTQTTDEEVIHLLGEAAAGSGPVAPVTGAEPRAMIIPVTGVQLHGDLAVPPDARGLVIFAHGSGSSRKSPRNRRVAAALQRAGFATLLFDLLTADEEVEDASSGEYRFDIDLLSGRLAQVAQWAGGQATLTALPVGYFGASTGAAAALKAAAARPRLVAAVVSRGGRPDLAGDALRRVSCPTLLIVGALDRAVIELNRLALAAMDRASIVELEVVPGATHLFEEPGTLDEVIELARNWFLRHLAAPISSAAARS